MTSVSGSEVGRDPCLFFGSSQRFILFPNQYLIAIMDKTYALICAMNACTQALILTQAAKLDEDSPAYKDIVNRSADLETEINDILSDMTER
jgi:hypothetical protein